MPQVGRGPRPYLVEEALADETLGALQTAGFTVLTIDCSDLQDERDLLQELGRVLHFPDYFGVNWDAFDECLGDDQFFQPGALLALAFTHAESVALRSMPDFVRFVHMLIESTPDPRMSSDVRVEAVFFGRWLHLAKLRS